MKTRISEIIEYQPGTLRTVRKFAWLPRRIKEYKIWLCDYEELWIYRLDNIPALTGNEQKNVVKQYWDKVDERVL